jgi:hypothetical protein
LPALTAQALGITAATDKQKTNITPVMQTLG